MNVSKDFYELKVNRKNMRPYTFDEGLIFDAKGRVPTPEVSVLA